MTLTPPTLAAITARFRDPSKPKINQAQLADYMGYGRSWATKLMKGGIKNLSDEDAFKLQKFLGVRLVPIVHESEGPVSPLAMAVSEKMKENKEFTTIVSSLLQLMEPKVIQGPRWVDTQDMTKIGQEIIKIAFANEDKPGKVARMVLELLA